MWQPIGDSQFPLPLEFGVCCGIQTRTGQQHCVCARKWGWLSAGVTRLWDGGGGLWGVQERSWSDLGARVSDGAWSRFSRPWVHVPLPLNYQFLSLGQRKCVWTRNQWGVRVWGGKLLQSITHACGKDRCSPYGRADMYCCRSALWFGVWQPSSFW